MACDTLGLEKEWLKLGQAGYVRTRPWVASWADIWEELGRLYMDTGKEGSWKATDGLGG